MYLLSLVIFQKKKPTILRFVFLRLSYFYNNLCLKNTSLEQFDLSDIYINLIKSAKLLPSVNGHYISKNDEPYIAPDNLPHQLNGNGFDKILIPFTYNEREAQTSRNGFTVTM